MRIALGIAYNLLGLFAVLLGGVMTRDAWSTGGSLYVRIAYPVVGILGVTLIGVGIALMF